VEARPAAFGAAVQPTPLSPSVLRPAARNGARGQRGTHRASHAGMDHHVLRITRQTVTTTHSRATIQEVCETMVAAGVGAVVVLDDGRLVGIISERDIVGRVVVPKKDLATTRVADVMTREVRTASSAATTETAMEIMDEGGFRHLPLLDASGRVVGVVSMRDILRDRVDELDRTSESLVDYFAADGPGG
jgi:CBS domain-containing protein